MSFRAELATAARVPRLVGDRRRFVWNPAQLEFFTPEQSAAKAKAAEEAAEQASLAACLEREELEDALRRDYQRRLARRQAYARKRKAERKGKAGKAA